MEDLLQVGVITTTHGVRGEVKVFPTTDDPARFKKLKNVILDTGKEKLELEIAGVKFFKNMVILKFKGIDDINDVEKYRKKSLYVTRENAVKLKKDEYFIASNLGLHPVHRLILQMLLGMDFLLVPEVKWNISIECFHYLLHSVVTTLMVKCY